jgi:hypothetical protein
MSTGSFEVKIGTGLDRDHFDPELLYVECGVCGRPVMWGKGQTSRVLRRSNINLSRLDEHCLLISDGCPMCSPGCKEFKARIVRLA